MMGPKWLTIHQLEVKYYEARGIEYERLLKRVWKPYDLVLAEQLNAAHDDFCRLASEAALSGVLRFMGKIGTSFDAPASSMNQIPESYFIKMRGFEGETIVPFRYGAGMDEYVKQLRTSDPYYHEAIVESAGSDRWLNSLYMVEVLITKEPTSKTKSGQEKQKGYVSRSELTNWFRLRQRTWPKINPFPNETTDWKDAKQQLSDKKVPRQLLRDVRRIATDIRWQKQGRRIPPNE